MGNSQDVHRDLVREDEAEGGEAVRSEKVFRLEVDAPRARPRRGLARGDSDPDRAR